MRRIWKWKEKRTNKNLTFRNGDLNSRFSVIFPPMIWIFMEKEEHEIKSKQTSKRDRTLKGLDLLCSRRGHTVGQLIMNRSVDWCQSSWLLYPYRSKYNSNIVQCILGSNFLAKGQLISKEIYGLLTSPKKRTDEFDLFAFYHGLRTPN